MSNEVYRLHNLIQYDHDESGFDNPELHELALMQAQLTQLALLACLQTEAELRLEDLRNGKSATAQDSDFSCAEGKSRV